MNGDQNEHRPLAEIFKFSLASERIKEAEILFLLDTFWTMFRFGLGSFTNPVAQLKRREEELQRIRRLFLFLRLGNTNSGCSVGLEAKREIDADN